MAYHQLFSDTSAERSVAPKNTVQSHYMVKLTKTLILDITVGVLVAGMIGLGIYNLIKADDSKSPCKTVGQNHTIELRNDTFPSDQITVTQCDTLTIVNLDTAQYLLAFGVRASHVDYPGYEPQRLAPNESIGIDMIKAGTFEFHDHLRDNAHTVVTIKPL